MAFNDLGIQIRIAAVVDELGAAPTGGSIHRPVGIELKEIVAPGHFCPAFSLATVDPFSGVLDHLTVRRDPLGREHPPPVDFGTTNAEFEAAVTRVQVGFGQGEFGQPLPLAAVGLLPGGLTGCFGVCRALCRQGVVR